MEAAVQLIPETKPPATVGRSPQYSPELDTVRALAIISVLIAHFVPADSMVNHVQQMIQQGPAFGVPLFFALSGFLITRILVQSRATVDQGMATTGHSLYVFYARRFLRIFPIYYATLFVGVVLHLSRVREGLPWHLAYLSNFYYRHLGGFDHGPAPVFWTLAVEEQFYLLWPLVFLFVPTRMLPRFTLLTVVFGAIYAGWGSVHGLVVSLMMPSHIMYLALGSFAGLAGCAPFGDSAVQQKVMNWYLRVIPMAAAVGVAASFVLPESSFRDQVQNGARYLGTALLFAWIVARLSRGVGGWFGHVLRWGPLTYIGRISYGIYIIQFFVTQMLDRSMPKVAAHIGRSAAFWLMQSFPARMVAILCVASASFFLYEKPINDLKRFFPYPRAKRT